MFLIGALPILLLPFIYFKVPESPVWLAARERKENHALLPIIRQHWKICIYMVLLMACFNFFSHGTQDLYPTFLKVQHQFDAHTVSIIAIGYNIAAMLGGITFGSLSERIGRKSHHAGVVSGAAGAAAVGVLQRFPGDWDRRVPDAVYGAGRMGRGADHLTELVPANARAVLPLRLPAGEFNCFGQRHAAVTHRRSPRR